MNRLYRHAAWALLLLAVCRTQALAATLPPGFAEAVVTSGLSNPTAMTFAPDGRLFVCLQGGQVRVIQNGTLLAAPFVTLNVDANGERGLLGLAFDPDFSNNHYVYIYYTATTPSTHNRVSRLVANGNVAVAGSETVILDLDNLSSATNHNGGALHFGIDGKLYIGVGENANPANAQVLTNLLGKILRINADGTIPQNNPFIGQTMGKNGAIWALGLRNPYTFAFQPLSGRMFINDVGAGSFEEINDGFAGSNYGWNDSEGPTTNPNHTGPIYYYPHGGGPVAGCAITGGAFYNPNTQQFPATFTGTYFFADFCSGWIKSLDPGNNYAVTGFATGISSPVDLQTASDGSLYYLARGSGSVVRIFYTGNQAPQITLQPTSQTIPAGQPVTFTVSASGAPAPAFQWQRNQVNIPGATNVSYSIGSVSAADNGARFRAIASNVAGSAASAEAILTVVSAQRNVALASNGGVAVASSTVNSGFAASGAINGDRKGVNFGAGGGWNDGTPSVFPDWLEVDFAGPRTIDEIDVFTLQDNYTAPIDPTPAMTFSGYGIRDFDVQYWDGTAWQTVAGGHITGNNNVWRTIRFAPVSTTRIRIFVTNALEGYSRIVEVEAYESGGAANTPPTVNLTNPTEGASFAVSTPINLAATAGDVDGTVKRVDFYANGALVGSDATSAYGFTWTPSVAGPYSLTAVATDNLDATTTSGAVHVTVNGAGQRLNVALAANGGLAVGSSTANSGFAASGAINGDRKGVNWGAGGGWNDGTPSVFPDSLEVDFSGAHTIDEIDVFTLQDNYTAPSDPTAAMTFTGYGLRDFDVQYWDGAAWQTVAGGHVTGNNKVWRTFTFAAVSTTRIRVFVTNASAGYSRIVEVEAYESSGPADTPPTVNLTSPTEGASFAVSTPINLAATAGDVDGTVKRVDFYANGIFVGSDATSSYAFTWTPTVAGPYTLTAVATDNLDVSTTSAAVHVTVTGGSQRTNLALASNGGVAMGSSTVNGGFAASGAINGDRKGMNWGAGGGWNDGTPGVFPDWLEVVFNGTHTIDEIDVFTLQDNYTAPIDPTPTMTFTGYGLRDFTVQYWDGAAWQTVAGGQITGNNNVWRTITFAAVSTNRIRILVANALGGYSRIVEVEAYETP